MSSQGREDEILARLFAEIGTTNRYAVEIGARDGMRGSNTCRLRVSHHWTCLLLDMNPGAPFVRQAFVTAENVNEVFAGHGVPPEFDLLSIDIDGNDFHVWRALAGYVPRVVVIEYNSTWGSDDSVVIPYRPEHRWDRTNFYGASAAALVKLGREKGYVLVDVVPRVNLIVVRDAIWRGVGGVPCAVPPADPCGHPVVDRSWQTY